MFDFFNKFFKSSDTTNDQTVPKLYQCISKKVDPRLHNILIQEIIHDASFGGNIGRFDNHIMNSIKKFSYDTEFVEKLRTSSSKSRDNLIANAKISGQDNYQVMKDNFWALNEKNLRKAHPADYREWLRGFMNLEGKPTHYYDRNLDDNFYVATGNIQVMPLYGSISISIIVPSNIEISGRNLGHINIYFMKDFTHLGSWVPLYDNVMP